MGAAAAPKQYQRQSPLTPKVLSPAQEVFAGFVAGVTDAFACHPMDVMKTRVGKFYPPVNILFRLPCWEPRKIKQ